MADAATKLARAGLLVLLLAVVLWTVARRIFKRPTPQPTINWGEYLRRLDQAPG